MRKASLFIFVLFFIDSSFAQDEISNYYWLQFSDKEGSNFTIEQADEFLSARAIARRNKQNVVISQQDLPVSQVYLNSLRNKGAEVIHTSKWLNGATIKATASIYQEIISSLSFIQFSELTKPGATLKSVTNKFITESQLEFDSTKYGSSFNQLALFNGQFLHEQNFLGEGIYIAVIDAGFQKVDELPAFEKMIVENRILGTRDFVSPGANVFVGHSHGTNVLSTMGGDLAGQLIGTAPKASYYLLRSEDVSSEYLIEEDNWVVAAEYADSLGCDIINSSLGYSVFDDETMNHTYADMDGTTTRISKAANIAVEKGMLVFSSSGNEAANNWKYLVAPSDGDLVIGVGAVNKDSIWAPFSSIGPAADGSVKPNLAAVGWGTVLQKTDGSIGSGNGTSFSSPVLAGMAACLWQANPQASMLNIKEAIEMSASQYANPDSLLGYGIPNFKQAHLTLSKPSPPKNVKDWFAVPNPFHNNIYIYQAEEQAYEVATVSLFSLNGSCILKQEFRNESPIVLSNLAILPPGLFIAKIESNKIISFIKLLKVNPKN